MNPEKTTRFRAVITDRDRDNVMRLTESGLSVEEIADIMHISRSCIGNIRHAHKSCVAQDWSALQKLSHTMRATLDWAMRVTGTDKVFLETFPKEEPKQVEPAVNPVPTPDLITREDFLSLQNTLQDICYLLTEIRDTLK